MAGTISKTAVGFVLCGFLLLVAFFIGEERGRTWANRRVNVQVDTLYVYDSIMVDKPVKITEWKTRTEYVPIKDVAALDSLRNIADSLCEACELLAIRNDSLMLALAITTAHYKDSLCEAWVSGWHPSLDSIKIYQRERLVIQHVTEYKPFRWCVGITGGVGAGKDGLTPFVGVGLTYAITSF